ncbi:hypothetical protein ABT56_07465 [Photobacterium aquae]|uniref:Uncharacterized protein n=2 Tax=Photobacterium aquae TaxID=1195763 RepID=A0A0J1H5F2_9GAMM|nr:hypothetical protein ABT56_07465 [Photobacterium aquae]
MSVNLWVETEEQIFDMVSEIGRDAGCDVRGDLRVYKTEPKQAAQNDAYGYGINFAPYGD